MNDMKTLMTFRLGGLFPALAIGAGLFAAILDSSAQSGQDIRFFRIAGPAATRITALRPDGTVVWSNALTGTNYTVQTSTSLGGVSNWVDYVQIPVINRVNTNRLVDPSAPSGMAF